VKRTVTVSGTELDLVTWAVRGLIAVIMFFLGQLYHQVQNIDSDVDGLKSDRETMKQSMLDHGWKVTQAEKKQ
jgi:uncharacterized protein YabE (DUF348 family)